MAEAQLLRPRKGSPKFQNLVAHYKNTEQLLCILYKVNMDDPVILQKLRFTNWYAGNNTLSIINLDEIINSAARELQSKNCLLNENNETDESSDRRGSQMLIDGYLIKK